MATKWYRLYGGGGGKVEGLRFDAVFTVLAVWLAAGVAWDFNIHAAGIDFAEEGFFTLPHLTFYSAFLAIAILLAAATFVNSQRGYDGWEAVPHGYRLGLVGVAVFLVGGPADFAWHSVFGVEVGVEGLTSPSHLLLAVGAALFLSSPLRAAWFRDREPTGAWQVPLLISAGLVAALVAYFTIYQNPLIRPLGAPGSPPPDESFLGILWFAAILAATVVTLLRRFRVTPGGFTLVFTLIGAMVTVVIPSLEFLPAMVLTGLTADLLYTAARDRWPAIRTLRVLAAGTPVVVFAVYFATIASLYGIAWSVHVWTGGIASAGLIGLLVTYAMLPSRGAVGDDAVAPDDAAQLSPATDTG